MSATQYNALYVNPIKGTASRLTVQLTVLEEI